MKALSALLLAGTAMGLASGAAYAQQTQGWYLGPEAGWTHMNSPDADIPCGQFISSPEGCRTIGINNPGDTFKAKMNEGFGAGLAVGYQGVGWPGLRVEGEAVIRNNGVKSITDTTGPLLPAGTTFNAQGGITSLAFMVNGIYDFMPNSQWTPYLGVGIGAARLSIDGVGAAGIPITASATTWQFAYQGIAGVKYAFNPKWSATLDYRYFATPDPKFTATVGGVTASTVTQYSTHNVFLGVQYHFGVPTPPPVTPVVQPAAPPPSAAPRLFIVYFDFDKSNLTTAGAAIVHEAADTFKKTGSAKVMVTGYTDLAGTQQYNLGLSKRRADTVKGALVKEGVPTGAIVEAWRGKENPAVPTADGVREARNRRVEIVLP